MSDWNTWGTVSYRVPLVCGSNSVMLKYDSGDSGNINIDALTLVPKVLHGCKQKTRFFLAAFKSTAIIVDMSEPDLQIRGLLLVQKHHYCEL